jgi:hypothetical protein
MRRSKTAGKALPQGGGALARASQFALSRGLPPPATGQTAAEPAPPAKKKPAVKAKAAAKTPPTKPRVKR